MEAPFSNKTPHFTDGDGNKYKETLCDISTRSELNQREIYMKYTNDQLLYLIFYLAPLFLAQEVAFCVFLKILFEACQN